ncbi:MAG: YbdD/YjiX family protein [Proteobacteria bacterium]|nr:YbdD/YjiX family protein [Pseudomonadota bacterium]MDA1331344.1 YbdD/YjiX family protein [Pseudomonadota bacterium]
MNILKKFWAYIRQASGDDAYERYCAHHQLNHHESELMNRAEYFEYRQHNKWSGVTRCC